MSFGFAQKKKKVISKCHLWLIVWSSSSYLWVAKKKSLKCKKQTPPFFHCSKILFPLEVCMEWPPLAKRPFAPSLYGKKALIHKYTYLPRYTNFSFLLLTSYYFVFFIKQLPVQTFHHHTSLPSLPSLWSHLYPLLFNLSHIKCQVGLWASVEILPV